MRHLNERADAVALAYRRATGIDCDRGAVLDLAVSRAMRDARRDAFALTDQGAACLDAHMRTVAEVVAFANRDNVTPERMEDHARSLGLVFEDLAHLAALVRPFHYLAQRGLDDLAAQLSLFGEGGAA